MKKFLLHSLLVMMLCVFLHPGDAEARCRNPKKRCNGTMTSWSNGWCTNRNENYRVQGQCGKKGPLKELPVGRKFQENSGCWMVQEDPSQANQTFIGRVGQRCKK